MCTRLPSSCCTSTVLLQEIDLADPPACSLRFTALTSVNRTCPNPEDQPTASDARTKPPPKPPTITNNNNDNNTTTTATRTTNYCFCCCYPDTLLLLLLRLLQLLLLLLRVADATTAATITATTTTQPRLRRLLLHAPPLPVQALAPTTETLLGVWGLFRVSGHPACSVALCEPIDMAWVSGFEA